MQGDTEPVAKPLPAPTDSPLKRRRRRKSPYRRAPGRPPRHGAAMLTRVLRAVRFDSINGRSKLGVYMRRLRQDLVNQLGGDVTPAQMLLIEEAAKKAAIVQTVGNYVLTRKSLLTETKDGVALLPVVLQHDQLSGGLVKLLMALGLERRGAKEANVAVRIAAMHETAPPSPTKPSD